MAPGQTAPYYLAVDATHVYWSAYGEGTIMKVPIGGGTPVQLDGPGGERCLQSLRGRNVSSGGPLM